MKDQQPGAMRWDGGWHQAAPPPSPQECPVAIVIDGMSQAVLMATPHDLRDFALGFALTEGLIASPADVEGFEEAEVSAGGFAAIEARLWLRPGLAAGLAERRRSMVGPVGCGLCGVDSIAAALPAIVPVASDWSMPPGDVARAIAALAAGQVLRAQTPAIHGAAFWDGTGALTREDVGRHNALDKLIGAMARQGIAPAQGAIVLTSRVSTEMVQKCVMAGCAVLIAVSAPTLHALRLAEGAGLTLAAFARGEGFDLFCHPERLRAKVSDVA